MTDEEVICGFMEPRPVCPPRRRWFESKSSLAGWWELIRDSNRCQPRPLTLDALYEVESQLTDEQQWDYCEAVRKQADTRQAGTWHYLHATAEQKIKALAAVLRPLVEGK